MGLFVLKMSSHFGMLTEAFDSPYKFKKQKLYAGYFVYRFIADDRSEIDVLFKEDEISEDESVWRVNFERNTRQDVTGEGDAMRIFATVIEILKDFTKKEKPQELAFSAFKPERGADPKELSSREKLYKKLVQRYSGRMGYKYTTQSDNASTDFRLVRK